jgi:nitric oxide reductase subunit B
MTDTKKLWVGLGAVIFGCFGVLGFFGREVYRQAPPIPARVVTARGVEIATRDTILDGQEVWQRMGGQQVGSIWGHGAYQAPDWSADWLHREATALNEIYARDAHGVDAASLTPTQRAAVEARVRIELRANTYYTATGKVAI